MINIFGDSTVRELGNLKQINVYFLGRGSRFNLADENVKNVKEKLSFLKPKENDENYLALTAPNILYQVCDTYLPFRKYKIDEIEPKVNKEYLNKVLNNYYDLVQNLHFECKLISPYSPYPPMMPALVWYNKKLKEKFGEDKILDIFSDTIKNGEFDKSMRLDDFEHDPIHFNKKIVNIFENKMGLKFEYEDKTLINKRFNQYGTIIVEDIL